MAEMANTVISFLLANLTQLLAQEANLLAGVESEIRALQTELRLMHGFLRDVEGKLTEHQTLKEIVSQIRDVAYQAEDVIDTFITYEAKRRRRSKLGKLLHALDRPAMLHEVGKTIKSIQKDMTKIYENRERFGVSIRGPGDASLQKVPSPHKRRREVVEETDVVGFEEDAKMMVNRLIEGDSQREVISIVGMGGLGKTTLARKVYNDFFIKDYFRSRAWIFVSQEYRLRALLLRILKQITGTTNEMYEMEDDELSATVHNCLKGRRYLIVMDDVWKNEVWEELKRALPDHSNGSRILLTSRLRDVASYANPHSSPHLLRHLGKEESWELFLRKVFGKKSCPHDLEVVGKQIAEKCGGLPLAIVVLAGLLSKREKTLREWKKVAASVSTYITNRDPECREILSLSCANLPHHLKTCFLYVGIFPEDFEIPARQLIRLWISEGFVQQDDDGLDSIEATGEDYLEDLIDRSLIQVASRRSDGGVKWCRIHDLLRDLCIAEAKEEKFFYLDIKNLADPRRLAVLSSPPRYILSNPFAPHLRSFLCQRFDERCLSIQHWKVLYKRFTLLRVLDLGAVVVDTFPSEIEKLVLLRHLGLNGPKIRSLPLSICNLWNLQTIEMRASCIDKLPVRIWKMQQLRHLYFRGQTSLPEVPQTQKDEDQDVLVNLQTLSTVCPDELFPCVVAKFPKLKKLGVFGNLDEFNFSVSAGNHACLGSLANLESLERLKLVKDRWSRPLEHLLKWDKFPPNLAKLTISETQLKTDPMPVLAKLPNLRILKITHDAFVGYEISCMEVEDGFPKLEILQLVKLQAARWKVKAMPSLRRVVINECPQLILPDSLMHVPSLREIDLKWVNSTTAKSARNIQSHRGKDQLQLHIYPPDC